MEDSLNCPECNAALEEVPPVCQDGQDSCGCDMKFTCDQCNRNWYISCFRHHYGKEELEDPNSWH